VFDTNLLVAIGSFITALLAALYARRAWHAAKRQADAAEVAVNEAKTQTAIAREAVSEARAQNRVAIHNEQLRIFKGLVAFNSSLTASGVKIKNEVLWALADHAEIAEFYFTKPIADQMMGILDAAFRIQTNHAMWAEEEVGAGPKRVEMVKATYAMFEELKKSIVKLNAEMRAQLRLVEGEVRS
jgi:hypothetical protein